MIWLTDEIRFPPYSKTTKHGIIALGGDLSAKRLIHAYQNGIFPWFSEQDPILWYSPFRRMVLFPNEVKVSKSMKKLIRDNTFEVTENKAFPDVIHRCKTISRKDEAGTWITDDMERAYVEMHYEGFSAEDQWVPLHTGSNTSEMLCAKNKVLRANLVLSTFDAKN